MKALILLPVALGIGALFLLGRPKKASAATIPEPPPGQQPIPEAAPAPTRQSGQAAQQGGAECRQRFQDWQAHANNALTACKNAADFNVEWWRQEDLRLAGDPFFKQYQQDAILNEYAKAQALCDQLNAMALSAMTLYEECMRNAGLDPTKPSAATTGRRARYR